MKNANKEKQKKFNENLWDIATNLRGNMTINQFKDYIMGAVFYRFLSDRAEEVISDLIADKDLSYEEAWEDPKLREKLRRGSLESLGYVIKPDYLFSSVMDNVYDGSPKDFNLKYLSQAIDNIVKSTEGHESEYFFKNLFDDMNPSLNVLEKRVEDRTNLIVSMLVLVNEISYEDDVSPGDVYSYLIEKFAENGGLDIGQCYTPEEVSILLARLVGSGKEKIRDVYDPTCGSASLMLEVNKQAKTERFYGQEIKQSIANLAKMNVMINGIDYRNIDIRSYDIVNDPKHMDKKFEAIVANPPFGERWSKDDKFKQDERFKDYPALAPKTRADYVFIQHMLHHLDEDDGVMAVVMPHGVLFRGGAEKEIRKYLVEEKNYLDAVIGLPENLFYDTSISTVILIYKKHRNDDEPVLFIDASKAFDKTGNRNIMRQECTDRIVYVYENRETQEKYSSLVDREEIARNDYNLNIPRYVDTFEAEERLSKDEAAISLRELDKKIRQIDEEIEEHLKDFGIKI